MRQLTRNLLLFVFDELSLLVLPFLLHSGAAQGHGFDGGGGVDVFAEAGLLGLLLNLQAAFAIKTWISTGNDIASVILPESDFATWPFHLLFPRGITTSVHFHIVQFSHR